MIMKSQSISIASLAILLCVSACGHRNEAKEKVLAEREAWEASLPDSLRIAEAQQDSLRAQIEALGKSVNEMLPSFRYVDNPREVEGYYMANGWTSSYPLSKSGLVARLTKGEQLELIAALSGGAHFNSIRVQAGDVSAESSVVPHDQALNYRMAALNTVCFSDSAATECARVISQNADHDVIITFLNDGKLTGKISYPEKDKELMRLTWNLYEARRKMAHDQLMIPMLAKKAAIIQQRIEQIESKKK